MSTPASAMSGGLGGLARFTELRQRLFFVVIALLIHRLATHITLPGVDATVMADLFAQQEGGFVGLMNMFSGGALQRMSIIALGVMPYISASIIVQMLSHVYQPWIQLRKEGESGRRKMTQYTRYLTVALATFQAFSIAMNLPRFAPGLVPMPGVSFVFTGTVTLVTGTLFLMWLGEQITERGVGNGISILIFAGIVAGLPNAVAKTLELARNGELSNLSVILIFAVTVAVTAFVIFVERGQRRITVNYAKRQQGRRMYAAQSSHLPLKLNMAGVIPPIFASSIILFPTTIASWFGSQNIPWLRDMVGVLSPGQPIYITLYGAAIIFFCFFYTALIFDARDTADNLKKAGALLPGIRPGEQTARYIDSVMSRLTMIGAIYITAVCLLPEFLILSFSVPFYFGGTSLLIIVVVVMDFVAQVQTHLMSHQYESLMKKANLRGFGRR
ncbi:MAG: preprotein translocase subunit SecY [Gammaproteobacteria bacterium]|nr:preprotein translocase subunit SecY [Gammaproteobacteria bacterium]